MNFLHLSREEALLLAVIWPNKSGVLGVGISHPEKRFKKPRSRKSSASVCTRRVTIRKRGRGEASDGKREASHSMMLENAADLNKAGRLCGFLAKVACEINSQLEDFTRFIGFVRILDDRLHIVGDRQCVNDKEKYADKCSQGGKVFLAHNTFFLSYIRM
jgi:hypothetical protein